MSTPAPNVLTYNGYINQIATMAVVNVQTVAGVVVGVDAAFNTIIPQMLNYAELRIQRDLDLYPALTSNTTYATAIGSNLLNVSTNDFVAVENIILTASGVPLLPVSKEFLQNVYGTSSVTGPPTFFAPMGGDASTGGLTSQIFTVGPYPDANYALTIIGLVRLPSLYAQSANGTLAASGTTWISTFLPDLLIMASMIYISAYQRNWGRQSDDPQMAQSYEAQYKALLTSAEVEERRKKFSARAWTAETTSPVATAG